MTAPVQGGPQNLTARTRLGSAGRSSRPRSRVIALIAIFPLGGLLGVAHLHELRMPWLGQPFVVSPTTWRSQDPSSGLHSSHRFFTVVSLARAVDRLVPRLAMNKFSRGGSCAPRFWYRGHPDGGGGTAVAIHLRIPVRNCQRDPGRPRMLKRPMVWFIKTSTAWLPDSGRRMEDAPFVALLLLAGLRTSISVSTKRRGRRCQRLVAARHITLPSSSRDSGDAVFITLGLVPRRDLIYSSLAGGRARHRAGGALHLQRAPPESSLRLWLRSVVVIFAITFGLALLYGRTRCPAGRRE